MLDQTGILAGFFCTLLNIVLIKILIIVQSWRLEKVFGNQQDYSPSDQYLSDVHSSYTRKNPVRTGQKYHQDWKIQTPVY